MRPADNRSDLVKFDGASSARHDLLDHDHTDDKGQPSRDALHYDLAGWTFQRLINRQGVSTNICTINGL